MRKFIRFLIANASLWMFCLYANAITPTFNVMQDINFGNVTLTTGNCRMSAVSGALGPESGTFLCDLPGESQLGKYVIMANPDKIVQIKIKPNLDNNNGYMFNPKAVLKSDVQQKVIENNTEFVEINSGTSGMINITLGGVLTIYELLPAGTTFNFSYDDAIEWDELN